MVNLLKKRQGNDRFNPRLSEVGGRKKGKKQIESAEKGYVVADDNKTVDYGPNGI